MMEREAQTKVRRDKPPVLAALKRFVADCKQEE